MVSTSDDRLVAAVQHDWPSRDSGPGQHPTIWQQQIANAAVPMGGQLHGRPYVGPPTEPSRAIDGLPLTDPVAIAYRFYSQSLVTACQRFCQAQDVAWQEYTRHMQDANAAYEVEARRAGLQLDQEVSRYHNG